MNAKETVVKFAENISSQNVDGLCSLMSEDHAFIDSLGVKIQGRESLRQGWTMYFFMVPDYHISLEEIIENDNVIVAFGTAGGTYVPNSELREENQWQVSAAWRAEVKDGLVTEWRVYADNEPLRQVIAKASSEQQAGTL